MKKIAFSLLVIAISMKSFSQDVKRKLGFGLQSSFPVFGISAKYGINEQSMVQATVAPFGASSGGGSVSLNFFGGRYIHRFPGNEESNVIFDPYLFAGGGVVMWKYKFAGLGLDNSTESFFSYSAGGGVEMIAGNCFGISAELGYGKIGVTSGIGVTTLLFGAGLHYYIN